MVAPAALHHRRTIRLPGYDYASPGAYFITIVAHNRAPLFGRVLDGEMQTNAAGGMVDATWRTLPDRFPNLVLGTSIVMPNHFHAIMIVQAPVGAALAAARSESPARAGINPAPTGATLGQMVGAFKSLVTRAYQAGAREGAWPPIDRNLWQRNYYEHIIRDETEWDRLRRYIESKPMSWDDDEENPYRRNT